MSAIAMIGSTDPNYYTLASTQTERHMRADFARSWQLRDAARHAETEHDCELLEQQAADVTAPWIHHESEAWRQRFAYLDAAARDWRDRPELMRRVCDGVAEHHAAGRPTTSALEWRSLQQARELTGHGPAEWAIARGSEQDAVRYNPAAPVPASASFAAARTRELAQSIPGHAFAGLVNDHDREGIER